MPQAPTSTSAKPTATSLIFTKHVDTVQVGPQQQRIVALGTFTDAQPAKGFSIDLTPEPRKSDLITSRILISRDDPDEYTLTLHIANHSTRAVKAQIWQI